MADLDQPLPKSPAHALDTTPHTPHKSDALGHTRHVSFSNVLTTIAELPPRKGRKRRRRCCSCCCSQCCIWIWIVILSLLLLFTLTTVFVIVIFEPRMLDVRIQHLNIKAFDFTEHHSPSSLATKLHFLVVTANGNTKMGFALERIIVGVSLFSTNLGSETMPAFQLGPGQVAIKQVETELWKLEVDEAAGEQMRKGNEKKEMIFGVQISCMARLTVGTWISPRFPMMVWCDKLNWPHIANGFEHKCKVTCFV